MNADWFEFGDIRVEMLNRRVIRAGKPVALTAKAFDTLAFLIQHRGETISKSELMDGVWGGVAVEENNLTQQISALRKAFGERPDEHRFIVTVPGRGYSFIAPVTEITDAPLERRRSSWRTDVTMRTAIFAAAILLVAFAATFFLNIRSAVSRPQTIAVLPFKAADGSDDILGTGMRYTLTAKLGNLQEILNVRAAVSDTVPPASDPILAGREMNVDAVLAGTIQHDGEQVRVTVQMLDVAGGQVIWARTVDAVGPSSFAVQDDVAAEVVSGLREFYARD